MLIDSSYRKDENCYPIVSLKNCYFFKDIYKFLVVILMKNV